MENLKYTSQETGSRYTSKQIKKGMGRDSLTLESCSSLFTKVNGLTYHLWKNGKFLKAQQSTTI